MKYEQAQHEKDSKLEGLISSKQKFERAIIIQEKIKDIISKIDALKSKIYDYEKEKSNLAKEIEALDEKNTQVSNFKMCIRDRRNMSI